MSYSKHLAVLSVAILVLAACSDRSSTSQQSAAPAPTPPPQAATPPPPPPPDPNQELSKALDAMGAQATAQGRVVRLSSAQFEPGETRFEPSDTARLDKIVNLLRDHPDTHVMIEGYTDSRGSENANQKVAEERATAVRQVLVEHGIAESRLEAQGRGEVNPIADNSTAEGREQNRRVELIFSDAMGRFASAGDTTPRG